MIISGYDIGEFTIRNREDFSIKQAVQHHYGILFCGLYYAGQNVVMLGINNYLVELDLDKMDFTKMVKTLRYVYHIEKVNDETFLAG